MIVLWLGCAVAMADDASTVQRIYELAWRQADALNVAAQIPGADVHTRAVAARALGRLGTPEALVVLEDLRSDRDPEVQVAVADALGWVPGGPGVARAWLTELGSPGLARSGAPTRRYAALVQALGVGGNQDDVPAVAAALREPWPVASVAADALTTMAARGVAGLDVAVPALISRLRGPDPRVVADVARALAHVGLRDQASGADIGVLQERLRRGTTPDVQAWLLRAVWPALPPAPREEWFLAAATATSRSLRVAALEALEPGDVPGDVVSTFLADGDPWIRHAALRALARDLSPEATGALIRHGGEATPVEAAQALTALGLADDGRALDPREPAPVRAALVAFVARRGTLLRLALDDEIPLVRTAAARALEARDDVGAAEGRALLAAGDPVVRWAGVRLVGRGGARSVAELVAHLRTEDHHAVQTEALRILARYPRQVPRGRALDTLLLRAASSPSDALRVAGARLATALHVDAGVPRPPPLPMVHEALRIRGARVVTDQGTFQIALEPERAPLTVASFARLAEEGFYDGLPFFDLSPGRYARTGCPRGDGFGDAGFVDPSEISASAFRRGTVAMAVHPLGGVGSQWLIATGDLPDRSATHTRFGRVVAGQYVLDRLDEHATVLGITIERVPAGEGAG